MWNEQHIPQSSKCSGHTFYINFITFPSLSRETNSSAYNLDFQNRMIICWQAMTAEKLIVKTIVETTVTRTQLTQTPQQLKQDPISLGPNLSAYGSSS